MEKEQKTALQRAQDKFTRVGTKLNERDMAKFNEILEREGVNQSQYIKGLIFEDRTHSEGLEELQKEIVILKNENTDLKSENHKIKGEKEKLNQTIDNLKKEVSEIEEMGLMDILKLWWAAKR